MCEVCRQHPCDSRCPNAPEEPVYGVCEACGDYIYVGDEFYQIGLHDFCVSCVENNKTTAEDYAE